MSYYPPAGFHFSVEILDIDAHQHDVRFSEVSGLSAELETEEVPEGGQNHFVQKYPVRVKHQELVLKRGLLVDSEIQKWVRRCLEGLDIQPKNVDVHLLNEGHEPLVTWHLVNAYPTKWALGDLGASSSSVAVETLQLYYQYLSVDGA